MRPLAVTSLKRSPSLPNVPAVAELSPGFEAVTWWGIVAPAKTPGGVISGLSREIVHQLGAPGMKEQFDRQGVEPAGSTPAQFTAFIQSELAKWGKVVKASGAPAE